LKKRSSIFYLLIIGLVFVMPGCSDSGPFGGLLPGFLKSGEKKEEPVIHKLKPTEEIRSSAPTGPSFTPSAVVPIGDEAGIPGKPGPGESVSPNGTVKEPPMPGEKQPPGTETVKKEGEKATPPAGLDKNEKPAPPEKTNGKPVPPDANKTPTTTPDKPSVGGNLTEGEDIAIVALVPEAGAPTLSPTKPVDSLMDKEYIYDPTGKRDPFRPFNLKVEKKSEVPPEELTPLQRYNLSQLKLTAIIYDSEKGTGIAMVEAPDKKGYNIIVGSEIGGGRVVRITETDVQVEMSYEDFYGNTEKRIETLKIAGGR